MTNTMKITIKTTANSLDPNNTTSNPEASLADYVRRLTKALLEEFPEAEIEHEPKEGRECTLEPEDYRGDIAFEIQRISEDVYALGEFWE